MVKKIEDESNVEMPPLDDKESIERSDVEPGWNRTNKNLMVYLSEDDGDSHASDGESERLLAGFRQEQYQNEVARLEAEYDRVRVELINMKKKLSKMENGSPPIPDAPFSFSAASAMALSPSTPNKSSSPVSLLQKASNGLSSYIFLSKKRIQNLMQSPPPAPWSKHPQRTPSTTKPRKRLKQRRWSLSNIEDAGMEGISRRRYESNGDMDTTLFQYADNDTLESMSELGSSGLHHRRHPHTPPAKATRMVSYSSDKSQEEEDDDDEDVCAELCACRKASTSLFWDDLKDRAGWLVGLMVLQSMSSFIIQRNEGLLQDHIIIVQFLTMLVGAGGNAGNQASVRVIRGLAIGVVTDRNAKKFLLQELGAGFILACILGISGCIRAMVFAVPRPETLAITSSLWAIVFISIAVGAILPLAMKKVGLDPAHSSTSIQVLMDIMGVAITVNISQLILS